MAHPGRRRCARVALATLIAWISGGAGIAMGATSGFEAWAHGEPTNWSLQSYAPIRGVQPSLSDVACPSVRVCVMVGTSELHGSAHLFSEVWNGSSWTSKAMVQDSKGSVAIINSVSCTAASQCTAVGVWLVTGVDVLLAERWNGAKWTAQSTTATPIGAFYPVVSCPAAKLCVAVGDSRDGRSLDSEIWNGSKWTSKPVPNPPRTVDPQLWSVSCPSTRFCVAVGMAIASLASNAYAPFSLTWDGSKWSSATISSLRGAISLEGVSCSAADACTAAGRYGHEALVLRWNGRVWSRQAAPASSLVGVSCTSVTGCTAVGSTSAESPATTVALSWNGRSWTSEHTARLPSDVSEAYFSQISCSTASDCTAIGDIFIGGPPRGIIERS